MSTRLTPAFPAEDARVKRIEEPGSFARLFEFDAATGNDPVSAMQCKNTASRTGKRVSSSVAHRAAPVVAAFAAVLLASSAAILLASNDAYAAPAIRTNESNADINANGAHAFATRPSVNGGNCFSDSAMVTRAAC